MLGVDEWVEHWSSAKGKAEKVGDSDTAPPGGSPPGLPSPGQKPSQASGSLKDVVHKVEWDGQRWIAVHHPNG
eukprot:3605284-Amphidinium_carterae.1